MAAEAKDSKSQHDYLGCTLHPHRQRGPSDPGKVATAPALGTLPAHYPARRVLPPSAPAL